MDAQLTNPQATAVVLALIIAVLLASRYPDEIKSAGGKVIVGLKSFNAQALMTAPLAPPKTKAAVGVFEIAPGTKIFFAAPTADSPPLENSFIVPSLSLKSAVENISAVFRPLMDSSK